MSQQISASQFKARCPSQRRDTPFGLHPALEICGDVIAPLAEPWDVLG
jgi:hypothetical protein